MNKKIAILTLYYNNYNYGGLLQSFALQRSINLLGYDSVQIGYRLETGYFGWSPVKSILKKPIAYMFHQLKYGRWFNNFLARKRKIKLFANQIPHTEVVTASSISNLIDRYDCFICGSDQIWNPIGWQPTLFLDFVPEYKIKISYAASIARDKLSEEQFEFIRKYLKDFTAISVREKNSAKMLNQMYPDLNVQDMPDPVFLLEESEWEKLIHRRNNPEAFIFAYFLGNENTNREKALNYAKKVGIKIIFAAYLEYPQFVWDKKHPEEISSPLGVVDFLDNIANASLVLTDSFHASAFSAILGTPFYVMPRFKHGDKNSMNSRIYDLLRDLNIMKRYINDIPTNYEWDEKELNDIAENIKRLRKKGLSYLEQSIDMQKEVC